MGLNNSAQQPAAPGGTSASPQQLAQLQSLQRLRGLASTPYQGGAPGGGASQGVAQLVAALLARRKAQALQQGQPNKTLQVPQPSTGPTPLPSQTPQAATGPTPLPSQTPAPSTGPVQLPQAIGGMTGSPPGAVTQLNLPPSTFGAAPGNPFFG